MVPLYVICVLIFELNGNHKLSVDLILKKLTLYGIIYATVATQAHVEFEFLRIFSII